MAVDQQYIKAAALAPAVPSEPIFRLTVDQYHQMIAEGVLTDDDPVELLEGWLVTKMAKNPPHSAATQMTSDALRQLLPTGWFINIQEPITTGDSEPEPDISVIRGERRDYLKRHPSPADVALVIEVSDTTLKRDRTLKQRLYARAGIPCFWIINLIEQRIEVYSPPIIQVPQFSYQQRQDCLLDQQVPFLLGETMLGALSVRDLLP